MIVSLSTMLHEAKQKRYAIGAFNIGNKDILDAIVQAAEDEKSPTIIECSEPEFFYLNADFFSYVVKRLQDSPIPFVLHLDHGANLAIIKEAILAGFNSVMIDASSKSFEDNVLITREVVTYAYQKQVCVEGELGTIGNTLSSSCGDGLDTSIIYTDPQKAKEFCENTGVDALAIAIGTSHGMYPQGQKPKLRIDILNEIQSLTDVCLVLHGGSGNADEEIVDAIDHGITKINISSEVKEAYFHSIAKFMRDHPYEVKTQIIGAYAQQAAYDMIVSKMRLFNSNQKC